MIEANKIYNEDCLEGLKRIPSGSVDLVLTDPPYLIETTGGVCIVNLVRNTFKNLKI